MLNDTLFFFCSQVNLGNAVFNTVKTFFFRVEYSDTSGRGTSKAGRQCIVLLNLFEHAILLLRNAADLLRTHVEKQ